MFDPVGVLKAGAFEVFFELIADGGFGANGQQKGISRGQ